MMPHKQRGVALVMAIMIVTLAAITATAITVINQRQIVRTNNIILRDQALQFTLMAEDYVMFLLSTEYENRPDEIKTEDVVPIDFLEENIDGILKVDFADIQDSDRFYIEGEIIDLESRININQINTIGQSAGTSTAGTTSETSSTTPSTILSTLLNLLEIEVNSSTVLRDSINDWTDTNNDTQGSSGAEQYFYLGLEKPYQAANRPILHLSTLRQIRGFEQLDIDQLEALQEKFSALPDDTKININTAQDDVLEAIGLFESTIENMVTPYNDVDDFIQEANKQTGKKFKADDFTVDSNYFLMRVTGVLDKTRIRLNSVIKRDPNSQSSKVIMRIVGDY